MGFHYFFFIQHNFVPILCISLFLTAVLKRKMFLAFASVSGIIIYVVLSLSVNQLSYNTFKSSPIIDTSKIFSTKAVPGGSLIPESIIQNTAPESTTQNTAPESTTQNTAPMLVVNDSVNPQSSILNTKITHLFYINFSNILSTIVSLEGLVWLVILVFLLRTLSNFRVYPTEIVLLVSIILLSYLGILMYDENFGTFLRHRSLLAIATIYCLLRIRKYRLQMWHVLCFATRS